MLERLRSVKLTVGLLLYLTAGGALATLVPQGMDPSYYRGHLPKLFAELVLKTGFDGFFTSFFFLFPVFLFFLNLTACSLFRFRRELRKIRGPKRFGPDILHFGLIILTVGAFASFFYRKEGFAEAAIGDKIEIPGGYQLTLVDFRYSVYDDGRPKDWVSTVRVDKNGAVVHEGFGIRVNNPLKLPGVKLYQVSHTRRLQLLLEEPGGKTLLLAQGERITLGDTAFFLMAPDEKPGDPKKALVHRVSKAGASVVRAGTGDFLGNLKIKEVRSLDITGLEAVSDPGSLFVFTAFAFILLGLALTFFQKLGDSKK